MTQFNIFRIMFLFFILFVPVLTFTMKENIIRDDIAVNKKHLKTFSSFSPSSTAFHSSEHASGVVTAHQKSKTNRSHKKSKRLHRASKHRKHKVAEEEALQRAITFTNPMVPLMFRDKAKKRPKKKNLKPERLLRKMGDDFNPNWMSVEATSTEMGRETIEMSHNQISQLFEQVNSLNLEDDLRQLVGNNSPEPVKDNVHTDEESNGSRTESNETSVEISKMASLFTQWLVKKSTCPVTFTWIDLGIYFWPRWIKSGSCKSDAKSVEYNTLSTQRSTTEVVNKGGCSWPKGMKCIQNHVESLQILRWHCRKRRKSNRKYAHRQNIEITNSGRKKHIHKCKWYKVPYPVTSSCKCSCN